jgi:hypothetical protein
VVVVRVTRSTGEIQPTFQQGEQAAAAQEGNFMVVLYFLLTVAQTLVVEAVGVVQMVVHPKQRV